MQITYELSFDDYRAAQLLHAKRSLWRRLIRILTHVLFPICGACFLVLAFTLTAEKGSFSFMLTMLVCGSYLVLCPFYLNWRLKSCYKRTRSGNHKCTVTFSEERVLIDAGNMKSEVDWKAVQFFREGDEVFMLYIAQARFIAIPKRVCTAAQIDDLRSLFLQHIKHADE
jgi:hypothetical protein